MDDRTNGTACFNSLEQRLNLAILDTADHAIDANDTAKYTGSSLIIPWKDYCDIQLHVQTV